MKPWWERFDNAPRDVTAWIDFVAGGGISKVVLIGHSFGAIKVVYSLAQRRDPRVIGLVIASPTLARHRAIKPELVALAERMESEGRSQELLPWGSHVSIFGALTVSAGTYLGWARTNQDVFGVDSADPAIAKIECPILAFYGTHNDVGRAEDLETIRRNARLATRIDTRLVEGAEHGYVGHELAVVDMMSGWIASVASDSTPGGAPLS